MGEVAALAEARVQVRVQSAVRREEAAQLRRAAQRLLSGQPPEPVNVCVLMGVSVMFEVLRALSPVGFGASILVHSLGWLVRNKQKSLKNAPRPQIIRDSAVLKMKRNKLAVRRLATEISPALQISPALRLAQWLELASPLCQPSSPRA